MSYRFTKLQNIDGHGLYVAPAQVVAILPIDPGLAGDRDKELYEAGARSWIVGNYGFTHASKATAAEVVQRIAELEDDAASK